MRLLVGGVCRSAYGSGGVNPSGAAGAAAEGANIMNRVALCVRGAQRNESQSEAERPGGAPPKEEICHRIYLLCRILKSRLVKGNAMLVRSTSSSVAVSYRLLRRRF